MPPRFPDGWTPFRRGSLRVINTEPTNTNTPSAPNRPNQRWINSVLCAPALSGTSGVSAAGRTVGYEPEARDRRGEMANADPGTRGRVVGASPATHDDLSAPCSAAVLWDLDNFDPGVAATPAVAAALRLMSGYRAPLLVSGHPKRLGARTRMLRSEGFTVLRVQAVPNAADRCLLKEARRLRRQGTRLFIVASNDHFFAPLALHASVVVLTLDPQYVSRALALHATAVLPLDPELARFTTGYTKK